MFTQTLPCEIGWDISLSGEQMKTLDKPTAKDRRIDPWWRKARIAARLVLKKETGQSWSERDRRLAALLSQDSGVTNRLIGQAVHSLTARRKYGPGIMGWFN